MIKLERIAKYIFAATLMAVATIYVVYTISFNRAKLVLDCTHYVAVESYMRQGIDLDTGNINQVRIWCDEFIDNSGRYRETD